MRFEHVDFGYEKNRQILFDVSFTIPAGKTVAVVGPSGAGKSTLSRLLFRFYDVTGGRITIERPGPARGAAGQPARGDRHRAAGHGALQRHIEYNIAYGRPGATHDEIVAAAQLAQIHDFIASTPEGYATPVGERGLKLSGGEKQRVAIARAVLKDPRILIFDEATSALDSKSEKAIQAELRRIAHEPHDADHRPPAVDDRRRRRDPGPRPRPHRRARHPWRASCVGRRVRADVAAAADRIAGATPERRRSPSSLDVRHGVRRSDARRGRVARGVIAGAPLSAMRAVADKSMIWKGYWRAPRRVL